MSRRGLLGSALAVLAGLVVVGVLPVSARASTFSAARLNSDLSAYFLVLEADGQIGDTLIRSEPGRIRVWFKGLPEDTRFDPPTDGKAIRSVRVRPGFGETMVVIFRLGDGRRVPESAVYVSVDGRHAVVRIPKSALPTAEELSAVEEEAAAEEADENTALAGDELPVTGAAVAEGGASRVGNDSAQQDEDSEASAAAGAAATRTSSRRGRGRGGREQGGRGRGSDSGTGTIYVLLLVSAVLGCVYFAIRQFAASRKKSPLDDIQIVAQKRLGTRHQIVLVRALGEDHLLSVNGQRTERIASSSTSPALNNEEDPLALRFAEENAVEEASPKESAQKHSPPAPSRRPPSRRPAQGDATQFGANLFRMALESESKPPPTVRPPRNRPRGESEAVAGLLRLRDRLAAS